VNRCYIGWLTEGYNIPKGKFGKDKPFIDLEGCKDIIIVDRRYFLENFGFIHTWALEDDDEYKDKSQELKKRYISSKN
jgi:hypothetical protein